MCRGRCLSAVRCALSALPGSSALAGGCWGDIIPNGAVGGPGRWCLIPGREFVTVRVICGLGVR